MKKLNIKRVIGALIVLSLAIYLAVFSFNKVLSLFEKQPEIVLPQEDFTTEHFIHEIGEYARELAAENDLYASVMIAQAMLESNQGRSGLASDPYHNLFGIKGKYNNQSVQFETLEDDGEGNMETIVAEFRQYPSFEASLEDYVKLLREGVSWDSEFYHNAMKSNTDSYKDVTNFLTGTYATDSSYEQKLNNLIEQYALTQYDYPIKEEKEITIADQNSIDDIAEDYQVNKTSLIQWNKLKSSILEKGQVLRIYETAGE